MLLRWGGGEEGDSSKQVYDMSEDDKSYERIGQGKEQRSIKRRILFFFF